MPSEVFRTLPYFIYYMNYILENTTVTTVNFDKYITGNTTVTSYNSPTYNANNTNG